MASSVQVTHSGRFALRPSPGRKGPDGAWWPQTRSLGDQLPELIDQWPTVQGGVSRILYSPPDWDDHPHSVLVNGRRMKTGSFPRDDTHQMTLVLHNGQRRVITVIPPETPRGEAMDLLRPDRAPDDGTTWDDEGGHA